MTNEMQFECGFLAVIGKKTLWVKEKMLVISIFSFSQNVFPIIMYQGCSKTGLCDKELMTFETKPFGNHEEIPLMEIKSI